MIVKGIKRYSWILLVIMLAVFWKAPLHAEAATTQVDNLVLMVNFSEDGDNTFSTNFNKYQEMYTGTASAPKRSLEKYISTISDEQVKVNNYFPQVVNGQFIPITITGTAQQYPNASDGELFVGAVINAVNQAGLSLPSKLDSRYNNGYIDNLTIIADCRQNAFGQHSRSVFLVFGSKSVYLINNKHFWAPLFPFLAIIFASFFRFMQANVSPTFISIRAFPIICV